MNEKPTLRLWQPPAETLESIAGVLRSHWRTTRVRPERPFWPEAAGWLQGQALRFATGDMATGTAAR